MPSHIQITGLHLLIMNAVDSVVHHDLFHPLTDMKFPDHVIAIATAMLQLIAPVVKD